MDDTSTPVGPADIDLDWPDRPAPRRGRRRVTALVVGGALRFSSTPAPAVAVA